MRAYFKLENCCDDARDILLERQGGEVSKKSILNCTIASWKSKTVNEPKQGLPYPYKFSRDVYFADATNSAVLRFYFRGSQDFVSWTLL